MKYIAILLVLFSGCATGPTPYYKGCFDGVTGLRFALTIGAIADPDTADYYCKVIERNHDKTAEENK